MQIDIRPQSDINLVFLSLTASGLLTIRKTYAWDGPSGPTIDSRNFMRGSLVHDALYQLMRLVQLPGSSTIRGSERSPAKRARS